MHQKSHAGSELDNIALRHRRPADNSNLPKIVGRESVSGCWISTRAEGDVFSPHYFRPGAHNDIECRRNGRSEKRARKRLNLKTFPTIMHVYCCFSVMPLTDFSNDDMPKITGREKISICKCRGMYQKQKG